jgi:hypothetical protein
MPELDFSARPSLTPVEEKPKLDFSEMLSAKKEADDEVLNNLPTHLRIGFWDVPIETVASVTPLSAKEYAATGVAMGHMMTDVYRGIKQVLGVDEDSMKDEERAMDALYAHPEVGTAAKGGAIAGALAEPIGLAIPGVKGAKLLKAIGIGTATGASYMGLSYVDEEKGETRLGNAMLGGTLGAVLSAGYKGAEAGVSAHKASKQAKAVTRAEKNLETIEVKYAEKVLDGLEPDVIQKEMKAEFPDLLKSLTDDTKLLNRKPRLTASKKTAADTIQYYRGTEKQSNLALGADNIAGIVSTRVQNISEPIFGRLMKYEKDVLTKTHQKLEDTKGFFVGYSKLIPKAEKPIVDKALLNGDLDTAKRIMDSHSPQLWQEYTKVQNVLSDLGDDLLSAGRLSEKREAYFPRYITDKEGLFKTLGTTKASKINTALAAEREKVAAKLGRPLTPIEETQVINKSLRGYPIESYTPGFSKKRSIDTLDDKLMPFYASPEESLHSYIKNAVQDLEKLNFFGRDSKAVKVAGKSYDDLSGSVGAVVKAEMKKAALSTNQQKELEFLLNTRFGVGEVSPHAVTQNAKNYMYAALLGNPVSAATQLGDLGVGVYINGFKNTLSALPKAMVGKGKVQVKDFGLTDHIAEEFATTTGSAKFLKASLKWSGFNYVDRLGKETLLNGAHKRYTALAKTAKGQQKIIKDQGKIFGDSTGKLIDDLNAGNVTEDVKQLLFNELARVQPITKSEVPAKYLEMPNGRVAYMLKSFMLKQADLIRRDAYNEIKKGNTAKGVYNLMRYGTVLGAAGAGSSYVKDFIKGKDVDEIFNDAEFSDIGTNFTKTFGWSDYVLDNVKRGRPIQAAVDTFAPPFEIFDKLIAIDIEKGTIEMKPGAEQFIPPFGKLYYYWYGGGLEKQLAREAKAEQE